MKITSDKTDEELLREYHLEKNPYFLNFIFSRYADVGFRIAMRYMRNQSDAEDVLQLAFIQFLQNLHFFREGAGTVKPWLLKMIVNTSINKLKEEKRRTFRQRNAASEKFAQYETQEKKTESACDQEELKIKIKNCVDTLPEKYRSPIWLVLYEGCTYPEVASILALPEKTVRTQVTRGLEKLRVILTPVGSFLSVDLITVLIANSNLETAPISVKYIIDSPELYKSISSKIINNASRSGRIAVAPNNSLFFFKLFMTIVALSLSISFIIYVLKKPPTNTTALATINTKLSSTKEKIIANEETNRTWSFVNETDRNIPLLGGKWKWSNESESMVSPLNESLAISLPVFFQQKPFVIECEMRGASAKENPGLRYSFMSFWIKEKQVLPFESFLTGKNLLEDGKKTIIRLYFYKNYICLFAENKCKMILKYSESLEAANVYMNSINYGYQKISSFTINAPPKEIINAIDSISNKTGLKFPPLESK